MGEVYLANHPRLPRADAPKIIGGAISADRSYQERFIREADLAAKLWHPNIVGVHDRGESEGQLWIAMDYVQVVPTVAEPSRGVGWLWPRTRTVRGCPSRAGQSAVRPFAVSLPLSCPDRSGTVARTW
jgi:hypothetical protein